MPEEFLGLPVFIWENIFTVFNTLVCGLIVAFCTSTFLKKKEERTRIAGVILEKRINSEQELLTYLEQELTKEEINIENSSKYDVEIAEFLTSFGLPVPYRGNVQYAVVFKNMASFDKFFHGFEEEFQKRRLWLDKKVREHLVYMQIYLSFFNIIPMMVKRIPLPKGQELTEKEFAAVTDRILFLMGYVCDAEINALMSELDELIVSSVYKLDMKRPSKSVLRNRMENYDTKKLEKRFEKTTIPGIFRENIYALVMSLVYVKKGINLDKMNNEEYEDFLKSSDPKAYQELQEGLEEFMAELHKVVEKSGVKIASKAELEKHPGEYAVSLKDILLKSNPEIKTTEEFVKKEKDKAKAKKKKKTNKKRK